jgi:hypothetical protein
MRVKSAPLVSIAIPAYRPRFFRLALLSALEQTYENLEIVICDDCRTDGIEQIVQELVADSKVEVRYLRNPTRLGFQQNLLRCLEESRGEFIKFLCDDDQLLAFCVSQQAAILQEHAHVSLVINRHHLIDVDNYALPVRLENTGITQFDALFNGTDMLAYFEKSARQLLGGLSGALMRRADVEALLPALARPGEGFEAVLDFALFICLLRRGHLVQLFAEGSGQRLHPDRLARQAKMLEAATVEMTWLKEMLAQRTGEPAPASGWVRYQPLGQPREPGAPEWEELNAYAVIANRQGIINSQVGTDIESYADLYPQWLACRRFSPSRKQVLSRQIARWAYRPKIVPVIIDEQDEPYALDITLQSIAAQAYACESVLLLSNGRQAVDNHVLRLGLQADWAQQLNGLLPSQRC